MELTEKEKELITTIRNYKRGYPRSKDIKRHIKMLFRELLED